MHGTGTTRFGILSAQQVRAFSALVRVLELPVHECPLWRPWCVSLLVPVV